MKQDNPQSTASPSLRSNMVKGAVWMVAMRWSIRGIGVINTIILARLLIPEDFGIVAMGMLIVGLLEVLSSFGVDLALIREQNAKRELYDTAWTFQVIQGSILCATLILLAPYLADYFNEPRVIPVVRLLALGLFINGLENIGVVAFRKELDFGKEFKFGVLRKITTFSVTVVLALVLGDYWALVIGIITGQVVGVLLSYVMHPYRPRLCLQAASQLWSFSQWLLLNNVSHFATNKIAEFVVGGTKSTNTMGEFSVATDLGTLPTTEVIAPLSRALFPGYSKLQNDLNRLSAAFLNVLSVVMVVAVSLSCGLAVVADDFVWVLLGEKWINTIPVIQWFAIYGGIISVSNIAGYLLIALNKTKLLALMSLGYLALLVPAMIYTGLNYGVVEIAAVRTMVALIFTLSVIYSITYILPVNTQDLFKVAWRPVTAVVVMIAVIKISHINRDDYKILSLLSDISVGVFVYTATTISLWYVAGKPLGAESLMVEYLKNRFKLKSDAH